MIEDLQNSNDMKILVVDDEELNRDILEEYLDSRGYNCLFAENGKEALDVLDSGEEVSAIILDRMMPVMGGLEFLMIIKSKEEYKDIPVIMQTAAATEEQVKEGIEAGVFYYLTKPYDKDTLLAVLTSALEHSHRQKKIFTEFVSQSRALGLMEDSVFKFKTLEEAKNLSILLASFCPNPEKTMFGLNEMSVNAIEHGNLGITYEEKKKLIVDSSWKDEVAKRLSMKENKDKYATLIFSHNKDCYEIRIKDMGMGFEHEKFLNIKSTRMTDPNGRGIAITKLYAFKDIEYVDPGNEVICRIPKV